MIASLSEIRLVQLTRSETQCYRQSAGIECRHVAAHRGLAGNEAADRLADAGRRRWMVAERAAALISCAPSFPPESRGTFPYRLADRIFWQGIKDEVDPLRLFRPGRQCLEVVELIFGSVNVRTLLPAERSAASRAGPPAMNGRSVDLADQRSIRRGFPSWVFRRRDAEDRLQVRVAALGCSPQLPTKRVVVVLSCGYGKTSWEIPGHVTCWSQSLVFFWSRATPRLGTSSSVCAMGLTARATKLKFRRGGVVPPHSSGAHVWFLCRSWCHAMPMRGLDLSRRWPLPIRRRIGRIRLVRNFMPYSGNGSFVCQPRCQARTMTLPSLPERGFPGHGGMED